MNKSNIYITKHFHRAEFTRKEVNLITPIQMYMLQNLCTVLESIRKFLSDEYGLDISIKITNGLRLPSDINRLRKAGYSPSETSDHLFGNVIKLRSKQKINKYGKYYGYSVGACDLIPSCGAKDAFECMRSYFDVSNGIINLPKGCIHIGQCILEKRNSYWIHVSNPPELIYSKHLVQIFFKRSHFLISSDNGRIYEKI